MITPTCHTWTMEERKQRLATLCQRFERDKQQLKTKDFNEANTRLTYTTRCSKS